MIILDFKMKAYMKMQALIRQCNTECAWLGVIDRKNKDTFEVSDIVVFPQMANGAHVEEDMREDKYAQWQWKLDDETFSKLKLHGHSHVNMSPSPSGTDIDVQQMGFEEALNNGDFRFYMISNKKGQNYKVGLVDGVGYDSKEIEIRIEGAKTFKHFLEWAASEIREKISDVEVSSYELSKKFRMV